MPFGPVSTHGDGEVAADRQGRPVTTEDDASVSLGRASITSQPRCLVSCAEYAPNIWGERVREERVNERVQGLGRGLPGATRVWISRDLRCERGPMWRPRIAPPDLPVVRPCATLAATTRRMSDDEMGSGAGARAPGRGRGDGRVGAILGADQAHAAPDLRRA